MDHGQVFSLKLEYPDFSAREVAPQLGVGCHSYSFVGFVGPNLDIRLFLTGSRRTTRQIGLLAKAFSRKGHHP